jgi:hypothetical protein
VGEWATDAAREKTRRRTKIDVGNKKARQNAGEVRGRYGKGRETNLIVPTVYTLALRLPDNERTWSTPARE